MTLFTCYSHPALMIRSGKAKFVGGRYEADTDKQAEYIRDFARRRPEYGIEEVQALEPEPTPEPEKPKRQRKSRAKPAPAAEPTLDDDFLQLMQGGEGEGENDE